jgi:pilus assembly protein CpaF
MVLDYVKPGAVQDATLDPEGIEAIISTVITRINAEFSAAEILSPDVETEARIRERIRSVTQAVLRKEGLGGINVREETQLVQRIEDQMLGLGFLERLLPPARVDLSEVMINQDGGIWVLPKGAANPVPADGVTPSVTEVRLVVDKILGAVSRRVSEAEPIVPAKLPRSPRLPAGARVNVVGPPVANGPYPIVNVRLYEEKPVSPDRLLGRENWPPSLSREMMDALAMAMREHLRVMIAGGTGTGKTTFLSATANFIPKEERIVLAEDPAEIFIDHPHVVSMEGRPPSIEGKYGVEIGDLVTTAMRQTPKWLVVGEVRTGQAAIWLMRAQMSDHPGLSTLHAQSPKDAVETLCLLAQVDMDIRREATKYLIARAIDLFVQLGYDRWGIRRCLRIAQVREELHHGDVYLDDVFCYDDEASTRDRPVWRQAGEITRTRR